jgi:hypothetical protein
MPRRLAALTATLFLCWTSHAVAQQVAAAVEAGAVRSATSDFESASTLVGLDVELRPIGIGRSWDFGIIGTAGRQPQFVMIKTTPASAVTSAYRSGVAVGGGFRLARATPGTETAIVGRAGSVWIGGGEPPLVSNAIGEWAAFFDAGVDVRWLRRDTRRASRAERTLTPLVDVYAGLRHDQRFHRAGDLSRFDDPTGRIVLTARAYPARVGWFAAGGAVDFERAWPGVSRLPSGWSIAAVGRLDLAAWATAKRHIRR